MLSLAIVDSDFTQSVWLQDLPLRSVPIPHDPKATDDFPAVLERTLHEVNVKSALRAMIIDNVNFPMQFLASSDPLTLPYCSTQTSPLNLLMNYVENGTGQRSKHIWWLPLLGSMKAGPV